MSWVAKRAVHVGGVGACAAGAVLADGEPLVEARPAMFERVEVDAVAEDFDPGLMSPDLEPKPAKPRRTRGGGDL